jgi:hypothetical protein
VGALGPRYPRLDCGPVADVAQLVEHFTRNEGVPGSSPGVGFGRKYLKLGGFLTSGRPPDRSRWRLWKRFGKPERRTSNAGTGKRGDREQAECGESGARAALRNASGSLAALTAQTASQVPCSVRRFPQPRQTQDSPQREGTGQETTESTSARSPSGTTGTSPRSHPLRASPDRKSSRSVAARFPREAATCSPRRG